MGDDLGYVSVKGKGSSECTLSRSNMHFTAHIGNIRRPSSYHNCSPGTHPTQPMRLPTPGRSECTYPCRTANAAQVGERAQRSTALFWTSIQSLHIARRLQPAACSLHRRDQQAISAFPLSLLISALAEPHSLFPFSISWWGSPLSAWPFTRQSDPQDCQVSPELCTTTYDDDDCQASRLQRFLFHRRAHVSYAVWQDSRRVEALCARVHYYYHIF